MDLLGLPGGDLVRKGVEDLAHGRETAEALLVSVASTRLGAAGIRAEGVLGDAEHRLYRLLTRTDEDSAHSRYNALLRRLVSFEHALECVS